MGTITGTSSPSATTPLFQFTEHEDYLGATLRPGNVHSAEDWDDLIVPEIERQQAEGTRVGFRADAAFAKPKIYDALEQPGLPLKLGHQ